MSQETEEKKSSKEKPVKEKVLTTPEKSKLENVITARLAAIKGHAAEVENDALQAIDGVVFKEEGDLSVLRKDFELLQLEIKNKAETLQKKTNEVSGIFERRLKAFEERQRKRTEAFRLECARLEAIGIEQETKEHHEILNKLETNKIALNAKITELKTEIDRKRLAMKLAFRAMNREKVRDCTDLELKVRETLWLSTNESSGIVTLLGQLPEITEFRSDYAVANLLPDIVASKIDILCKTCNKPCVKYNVNQFKCTTCNKIYYDNDVKIQISKQEDNTQVKLLT
jgi:hypothetical protein